jgi:hypothetical protein
MEYPAYYGGNITDDKEELIKEYEEKYNRKIPRRYVPLYLSYEDLKKQLDSIVKGTPRPELKTGKTRRSKWTEMARKYFGEGNTSKEDISRILSNGNPEREKEIFKGLSEIFDKGLEAYKTSGSRVLQSPQSWAFARMFSVLFNGKSRKIDNHIVEKYNIPLLKN